MIDEMTDSDHVIPVPGAASVRLTVFAGDPVSGTVLVDEQGESLPFCGWIELMAVINDVRLRPV